MRGAIARLAAVEILLVGPSLLPSPARAEEAARERAWYVPDRAKLQFAGNIGFLSPGVGWAFAREKLEADLFLGWVPKAIGGESLFSVTAKLTWLPWKTEVRGWRIHPLTAGLQLTNTFGENFFVLEPRGYPRGYHVLPTALRSGLTMGGTAGRPAWGLEEIGVYCELVALDIMLAYWAANNVLDMSQVFSLALGVRVEL